MKKMLVTLIAAPVMILSLPAFAGNDASSEPVQLTAAQMDGVTAARRPAWAGPAPVFKRAEIIQVNASPVTIVQIGNYNYAVVYSGNFASIRQ
jgi:hypothetical protein